MVNKAFEAIKNLSEDQIKEYLPIANLEIDEENDPEWVKDYKRFLKKNNLTMKTRRSKFKGDFNLSKDLEQSKKEKWLINK